MKEYTIGLNTLKQVVQQLAITRITTAIEKKLMKKMEYKDLTNKYGELENKLFETLTDEQKEMFVKMDGLQGEILCMMEEFIYRRAMVDAFRIRDIILGE